MVAATETNTMLQFAKLLLRGNFSKASELYFNLNRCDIPDELYKRFSQLREHPDKESFVLGDRFSDRFSQASLFIHATSEADYGYAARCASRNRVQVMGLLQNIYAKVVSSVLPYAREANQDLAAIFPEAVELSDVISQQLSEKPRSKRLISKRRDSDMDELGGRLILVAVGRKAMLRHLVPA